MNTPTPTPRTAATWNATIAQLHAEVERLRSDRDCEKRLRKHAEELREDAIERAARAEVERLKDCAFDKERTAWKTFCWWWSKKYDSAERQMVENATRAERAEAELDGIRALADRRNKRYHVEDTTHQLVAALDQALDIAQAELATERARLDWLESDAGVDWQWSDAARTVSRASIDAFMKEEAK